MNKQWRLTADEARVLSTPLSDDSAGLDRDNTAPEGMFPQNETSPPTSRKFEALAEFNKAKHAIWKITKFGIGDKEEIRIYRVFLAELGIRATAQAEKLHIIEEYTQK